MRPFDGSNPVTACVSIVIPVYRDAGRAIALLGALAGQRLPDGVRADIVVVDDGSQDGTADRIAAASTTAHLIRLPRNVGRASARNAGAAMARGEHLLFIDCDCLPVDDGFIASHLDAWDTGTCASIGPVIGTGAGFWHRYQSDASARRAAQHAKGLAYSGSSQNMLLSRSAFEACGGFDAAYAAYGFEDRDLQIRMAARGRIQWAGDAVVRHMDSLTLREVSRKMHEAGHRSSGLFSRRHPAEYAALGYAALDARLHPAIGIAVNMSAPLLPALARLGDRVLDSDAVPYAVKRGLVRVLTALSYAAGTAAARRASDRVS